MTANTAYTASSHEATKNSFSRRALIGGTAALGAVGLLSACGNGSASSEKTKAAGAGANIDKAAATILKHGGMELLGKVAKLHFANTEKAKKLL